MARTEARAPSAVVAAASMVCIVLLLLCGPALAAEQQESRLPEGAAIFAERCSKCHGDQGQGIAAAVSIAGPNLQAEHNLGNVIAAIEYGPNHMPAFSRVLSPQEIQSVAQYVTTDLAIIPLLHGDLGEGGKIFRAYCATCHRTALHGGVLVYDGRNAPNLRDKSAALIAGAIRWGPGTMPAFPATVLSDQQLASTVEYVRYVQHPPNPGGSPLKEIGPAAEGGLAAVFVLGVIGLTGWIERGGKG